jgi:predicted transcriptional regulator
LTSDKARSKAGKTAPATAGGAVRTAAEEAGQHATGGARSRRGDGAVPPRDGAPGRDDKAVARFVEDLASALMEMGVPRMPARVFAALLTTDEGRLTAAELAGGLQISPAAVSGAVRYLIQVGMVRRESEPGSRRHYYRAPDDVWDEVIGIRDRLMARWTGVLREGVDILGANTPAGQRVADSVRFFEFVSVELPNVIGRWRERRLARDGQAAHDSDDAISFGDRRRR